MDLNRIQLLGNLVQDPEHRVLPSGRAVTTLRLATSRRWSDTAGKKQEAHEFHRLLAWGKLADIAHQFLRKGSRLLAEGELRMAYWTGKDGQKHSRPEIIVGQLILLDRAEKAASPAGTQLPETSAEEAPAEVIEEEVKVESLPY